MDPITGKTKVPNWLIFVLLGLLVTFLLSLWYYHIDDTDEKITALLGGVLSGLIVALLTFVTQVYPLQQLDRFHRMGIKALLANRHDREYYRALVAKGRRTIEVMGASCSRFIEDFLDLDSDDKVLVDALAKHQDLTIKLLVPDAQHMTAEAAQRLQSAVIKLAKVQAQYPNRVELKRFGGVARHSFVIVDDEIVAGPIFEGDKSKYAPAVHVAIWTEFGRKYSRFFHDVWATSA